MSSLAIRNGKIAVVAAAAALGGAGVGFAFAQVGTATAAQTPRPTASGAPAPAWRPDGPFGLHRFGLHRFGFGGRLLHGEETVRTRTGGIEVVTDQVGTVTGRTGSTLTVTSSDKYVATYQVGSQTRIVVDGATATLGQLKTGARVLVLAVRHGGALDARAVLSGRPRHDLRPPAGAGEWAPPPAPAAGFTTS